MLQDVDADHRVEAAGLDLRAVGDVRLDNSRAGLVRVETDVLEAPEPLGVRVLRPAHFENSPSGYTGFTQQCANMLADPLGA